MTKKIIITSSAYINQLKSFGPILTPVKLDMVTIKMIVAEGHKVFEVLRNGDEIELNVTNLKDVNEVKVTSRVQKEEKNSWTSKISRSPETATERKSSWKCAVFEVK